MAKRRLTDLAKEYEISFDEAMDIAFNHLTEESITGRGKNTWIDEEDKNYLMIIYPSKMYNHKNTEGE